MTAKCVPCSVQSKVNVEPLCWLQWTLCLYTNTRTHLYQPMEIFDRYIPDEISYHMWFYIK